MVLGTLEEHRAGADPLTVRSGDVRAFGSQYAHDVRNASAAPAISIHAYSPPLTRMNKYELAGEQLVPLGMADETRAQAARTAAEIGSADRPAVAARQKRRSIAEVLDAARAKLSRLLPDEAQRAMENGAMLVDIRPAAQRTAEGEIPDGAHHRTQRPRVALRSPVGRQTRRGDRLRHAGRDRVLRRLYLESGGCGAPGPGVVSGDRCDRRLQRVARRRAAHHWSPRSGTGHLATG